MCSLAFIATRPVSKRVLCEVFAGQQDTAPVSGQNHHIGERDFFDSARVSGVNNHLVIHTDSVSDGQLHTCKQVSQHRLCSQTGYHRDQTGAGKQRPHSQACLWESHDDGDRTNNDDDNFSYSPQNLGLGGDLIGSAHIGGIIARFGMGHHGSRNGFNPAYAHPGQGRFKQNYQQHNGVAVPGRGGSTLHGQLGAD